MADIDIQQLVEAKLASYGDQIVTRIREKIIENGSLASGDLYNSISYDVQSDSGIVSLNIYANDYFPFVDQGRLPGKRPPIDNILSWVKVRGLRPKPGSGIPEKSKGLPRADRSLAFLIARKIGLDGIKPTNMLGDTLDEISDPLTSDINDLIVEAITEILGSQWEELAQSINSNIIDITVNFNRQ